MLFGFLRCVSPSLRALSLHGHSYVDGALALIITSPIFLISVVSEVESLTLYPYVTCVNGHVHGIISQYRVCV